MKIIPKEICFYCSRRIFYPDQLNRCYYPKYFCPLKKEEQLEKIWLPPPEKRCVTHHFPTRHPPPPECRL